MKVLWTLIPLLLLTAPAHAILGIGAESDGAPPNLSPVSQDVFMVDLDGSSERLNRFQIKLDLMGGSPTGVFFSGYGHTSPSHPPAFSGVSVQDLGSDFDTVFVSAALPPGEGRDVTASLNGLLAYVLEFGPDFRFGPAYPVTLDTLNTAFFDADGGRIISTPLLAGGILPIPEPSAMAVLLSLGLLAFRRPCHVRP